MVLDGHRHRNIVVIVILMPNGVNTYNMGGYGSSSKKYHCLMSKSLPRCIAYRSPWYTGLSLASTTTHLLCTWSPRRQEACSPSARMKQCCRTSSCSALAAPLRRPARGVDLRQSACTKCTSGQSSLTDTKATSTRSMLCLGGRQQVVCGWGEVLLDAGLGRPHLRRSLGVLLERRARKGVRVFMLDWTTIAPSSPSSSGI